MTLIPCVDDKYWHFDLNVCKSLGKDLAETYSQAQPFPNIALDDVFDEKVLEMCLQEFPQQGDPDSVSYSRAQENLKTSYNPEYLSPQARSFFYALNGRPFITFLENMTGIRGLIPDPYFVGGGFHQTKNGGHLDIHADFNFHSILGLERRINALIYLNHDWRPSYGGQLELWDEKMTKCVKGIDPIFNRLVVFSTTSDSYHGQPQPVQHPAGAARRSIALYYYTSTWDETKRQHTTKFQARPNSTDKRDYKVMLNELIRDLTPPFVHRNVKRIMKKS